MSNLISQQTEAAALPLTQALGRFVADIAFPRLPEAAVKTTRLGFTDCIGTMIAGSPDPCVQILRKTLVNGRGGEATLYFSSERCAAPEAAWINGTAAHALDYDDVGCGIGSWGAWCLRMAGGAPTAGTGLMLPSMKRLAVSTSHVLACRVRVTAHRSCGAIDLARFGQPSIRAHQGRVGEPVGARADSKGGGGIYAAAL